MSFDKHLKSVLVIFKIWFVLRSNDVAFLGMSSGTAVRSRFLHETVRLFALSGKTIVQFFSENASEGWRWSRQEKRNTRSREQLPVARMLKFGYFVYFLLSLGGGDYFCLTMHIWRGWKKKVMKKALFVQHVFDHVKDFSQCIFLNQDNPLKTTNKIFFYYSIIWLLFENSFFFYFFFLLFTSCNVQFSVFSS